MCFLSLCSDICFVAMGSFARCLVGSYQLSLGRIILLFVYLSLANKSISCFYCQLLFPRLFNLCVDIGEVFTLLVALPLLYWLVDVAIVASPVS